MTQPAHVRVAGAGPAGLMAAEVLAAAGLKVTIIDHQKRPARKFLLAGRGGLNLTNNMELEQFLKCYGPSRDTLQRSIKAFTPDDIRAWCLGLGIETFVGTSGRVFPKGLKASPLLRAWLRHLDQLGVILKSETPWRRFDDLPTILALGGASWPELGSDASWTKIFEASGITCTQLQASNGRQLVAWTGHFISRFAGMPLKNVAVTVNGRTVHGEIMITNDGIEGGAIYALSRELRSAAEQKIQIDLKPGLTQAIVNERMAGPRGKQSQSNFLRKALGLSPVGISLMRETGSTNPKAIIIPGLGPANIRRAISTAGGVAAEEIDENFQLLKFPNTYVVGEMLDWDAPTGGFLLHACLATARVAALDLVRKLSR